MKKKYFVIFLLLISLFISILVLVNSIIFGGDVMAGTFFLGMFAGSVLTWMYFKTELLGNDDIIIWSELFKKNPTKR